MGVPNLFGTPLSTRTLDFFADNKGKSLEDAIKEAYRLSDGVKFEGAYRRSDIGQKALLALN